MQDKVIQDYSPLGNPRLAFRCAISKHKYYTKHSVDEFLKDNKHLIMYDQVLEFKKDNPNSYIIDCGTCGIGVTYYIVSRKTKKYLNITNHDAW